MAQHHKSKKNSCKRAVSLDEAKSVSGGFLPIIPAIVSIAVAVVLSGCATMPNKGNNS